MSSAEGITSGSTAHWHNTTAYRRHSAVTAKNFDLMLLQWSRKIGITRASETPPRATAAKRGLIANVMWSCPAVSDNDDTSKQPLGMGTLQSTSVIGSHTPPWLAVDLILFPQACLRLFEGMTGSWLHRSSPRIGHATQLSHLDLRPTGADHTWTAAVSGGNDDTPCWPPVLAGWRLDILSTEHVYSSVCVIGCIIIDCEWNFPNRACKYKLLQSHCSRCALHQLLTVTAYRSLRQADVAKIQLHTSPVASQVDSTCPVYCCIR